MEDLDIVYCKDCKYFILENINENSDMMYCKKKNSLDSKANLYLNKKCYKKKDNKDNNKLKKAKRWKRP